MKQKQLRKLSRSELLEMLIELRKENEELEKKLEQANKELEKRAVVMEKAGSLAEASLILNDVFVAADNAAKHYLENIKLLAKDEADEKENREETEESNNG